MPVTTAGLRSAVSGITGAGRHVGLGTGGDANTVGTELSGGTYARVATTWPTNDTDGDWTGTQVTINTPTSATITWWGIWTAATGGELLSWARLDPAASGVSTVDVLPSAVATAV